MIHGLKIKWLRTRIIWIPQNVRSSGEPKPGLLDVIHLEVLIYAMQRTGIARTGPWLGAVIDETMMPPGLSAVETA